MTAKKKIKPQTFTGITIRMSDETKAKLQKKADAANRKLSDYCRIQLTKTI